MVVPFPPHENVVPSTNGQAPRAGRRNLIPVEESPPATPRQAPASPGLPLQPIDGAEFRGGGFITAWAGSTDDGKGRRHQPAGSEAGGRHRALPPALKMPFPEDNENHDPSGQAAEVLRRRENVYRLPAIATPRRPGTAGASAHIADADHGANNPANAVWRRYFFNGEKPMAFLRHFDVRVPANERPEKLLGGHVMDCDSAASRYYYTDFLLLPEFRPPFESGSHVVDLDDLQNYLETVQPRTRLDVYPLYLLLKGMLRQITDKETSILSSKYLELETKVRVLNDEKAWLLRRHEEERRTSLERLESAHHKIADLEMRLGRLGEEARRLRDYVAEMEQDEEERKRREALRQQSQTNLDELVMSLDIAERITLLNLLAGQTTVISHLNTYVFTENATNEAQEGLLKDILRKMAEREDDGSEYSTARKILARMFAVQPQDELMQLINEYMALHGPEPASVLVVRPFESSNEQRTAILQAALSINKRDHYDKEVLSKFGLMYASEASALAERLLSEQLLQLNRRDPRSVERASENSNRSSRASSRSSRPPLRQRVDVGTSFSREPSTERGNLTVIQATVPSAGTVKSVEAQTDMSMFGVSSGACIARQEVEMQTEPVAILDKDSSGNSCWKIRATTCVTVRDIDFTFYFSTGNCQRARGVWSSERCYNEARQRNVEAKDQFRLALEVAGCVPGRKGESHRHNTHIMYIYKV